tara:strand:+ start:318 stop:521 length:204 start_codon:yes stop_codon:yes gene_type:complete
MANLKTLKTNHYKSQLIPNKKLTVNNETFVGFKLNELIEYKLYNLEYSFNHKGLTFINKNLIKNLYI